MGIVMCDGCLFGYDFMICYLLNDVLLFVVLLIGVIVFELCVFEMGDCMVVLLYVSLYWCFVCEDFVLFVCVLWLCGVLVLLNLFVYDVFVDECVVLIGVDLFVFWLCYL